MHPSTNSLRGLLRLKLYGNGMWDEYPAVEPFQQVSLSN